MGSRANNQKRVIRRDKDQSHRDGKKTDNLKKPKARDQQLSPVAIYFLKEFKHLKDIKASKHPTKDFKEIKAIFELHQEQKEIFNGLLERSGKTETDIAFAIVDFLKTNNISLKELSNGLSEEEMMNLKKRIFKKLTLDK